jgi:3-oxoacyl-[acyl-carrier protein] reductase
MPASLPVAIITGASRGLGRGIARRLAEEGLSLVINYAGNAQAAAETVEMCKARQSHLDQRFVTFQADMALQEDRQRLVDQTLGPGGRYRNHP